MDDSIDPFRVPQSSRTARYRYIRRSHWVALGDSYRLLVHALDLQLQRVHTRSLCTNACLHMAVEFPIVFRSYTYYRTHDSVPRMSVDAAKLLLRALEHGNPDLDEYPQVFSSLPDRFATHSAHIPGPPQASTCLEPKLTDENVPHNTGVLICSCCITCGSS